MSKSRRNNKIDKAYHHAMEQGWLEKHPGRPTPKKCRRVHNLLGLMFLQGGKCWVCKETFDQVTLDGLNIDHWLPRRWGGVGRLTNLRVTHKRCNSVKGCSIPLAALKIADVLSSQPYIPRVCPTCHEPWPEYEGKPIR